MNRLIPFVLLLPLFAWSCSLSPTDPTGRWSREAQEPAMSLSGLETLEIFPDSTFRVTNQMLFAHTDTALECQLNMTINADGIWSHNNQGDLLMIYNPQSVTVEADSTSFSLSTNKPEKEIPAEMLAETFSGIISNVKNYYTQGYTSISANGGMLLMSPQIIDSCLYARIGSETVCWTQR